MSSRIQLDTLNCDFKDDVLGKVPDANLDLCLTCGACSGGCPATDIMDLDPRKFLRMVLLGMDEEVKTSPWAWVCTMCGRCMKVCPMKINIPKMVWNVRSTWPREERPKGIRESCDRHVAAGNAMGVPAEDFIFTVEDVAEEIREADERFKDMEVTVDRKGALMAVNQNSREPVYEPEEMGPLWKILHTVKADWTYPSVMWAGENYCMFMADNDGWRYILEKFVDHIDNNLGCKQVVNTECGHSYFALWDGLQRYQIKHKFKLITILELYEEWINEGKLVLNSDWNKDLQVKFTIQDPCNIVRKSLGDPMADRMRFILKKCVGDENVIEMTPNKSNNYCCGGGGGAMQGGYTEERRQYGKLKYDQVKTTGASHVVVPCHNCHSQLEDLEKHYGGNYHVMHFWTIMALSMGVLGPEERTYLGPELAEIGL